MNPLLQLETSTIDRSSRRKISKDTNNNTINHHQYRLLHPPTAEYIFFSSPYETFTKTNHIPGYKIYLAKIKRTEIIQCLLSDFMELNKKSITER